jgi:hypothetical protein
MISLGTMAQSGHAQNGEVGYTRNDHGIHQAPFHRSLFIHMTTTRTLNSLSG